MTTALGKNSNVCPPRDQAGAHAALKLLGAIEANTDRSYEKQCQICGFEHGGFEPCIMAPLTD